MSTIPVIIPVPIIMSLEFYDFHRFGSGKFCLLKPGAISVPLQGQPGYDSRVATDGNTVFIAADSSTGLALEFLVQPMPGDTPPPAATYKVLSVYFCGVDGQAPGVYTDSPDGMGVTIPDVYHVVGDSPSNWEFAVIVEQAFTTPDGKERTFVGVIDPPIDEKTQN